MFNKSEGLYHNLYKNIAAPICIIDKESNIKSANNAFEEWFGSFTSTIPIKKCLNGYFENFDTFNLELKLALENPVLDKLGNFNIINKNKEKVSVEIFINTIEDYHALIFNNCKVYKLDEDDITKDKSFSENLINSFPGLFYLFRISDEGVVRLIKWNKNTETLTGYSFQELVEKDVLEFFDSEDHSKIMHAIMQMLKENEVTIEANLVKKSGIKVPYEFLGKTITNGGKKYFFGLGTDISSRKKAEFLVNESKLRYKQLSNLTFEGILIHENGVAKDMNEAFARIFGYKLEDLLDKNLIELLGVEEDREKMYKYMATNHLSPYEVQALRKSGEKFPAEITGREINYEGRKARVVSVRDITERKKRESELTEHQLLLQRITEQSPDVIYIFDVWKNKNTYINKDLREILGYKEKELPDSSSDIVDKLIHPDDIQQFTNFYRDLNSITEDFVFEFTYRLKAKNGDWKWFAGKEKEFQRKNGKIVTMIGTLQDITPQKKYEQALLESEEQLSSIFENAPLIMVLISENGTILKMNKNAILKSNNDKGKQIGEIFNCINSFKDKNGCGLNKQCKTCAINNIINETFNNKKDYYKKEARLKISQEGYVNERFFLVSTKLMMHRSPSIALVTLDDITEQKLMEFDLKEAKVKAEESNKLKTAFLQNMSHEIRTPMNGIIGFSDMLNKEDITDERRRFYSDIIVNSSKQLLNVVNDILDISKIETGQAETTETETNLNQLFSDLFNFYQPQAWNKRLNIYLNMPLENPESFIWVDYIKLKQVLQNLLSNALKFTHEGFIRFGYKKSSNELIFYIEDSGIGVEKKYHSTIFEQFRQIELTTTREYGGTGLGLAISKAYVKLLGGKLWLVSNKGKGSIFYFTIPYKPILINEETSKIKTYQDKPLITRNKSILVAEDEYANFVLLNELLGDLDINVIHAKDGEEAIEIVRTRNISLALLDIKMPKLNGYETVIEIKKIRPSLPVVAQTAFATFKDKEKILGAGFDDYIPKPIQTDVLYEIVKKHLGIRT